MPKGRILAVDDQRYFRELIEGLLVEEGFEAQTASSGEEALRLLEAARFDVVVTDLVMPAMDGTELVRRIKERDPEQEVVVVTGVVDVKTAVEAMKLGATDYLLKPFDRSTLARSLEGILQRRRLRSEHARLLEENIEYMGERSLYERAIGLFASLSMGPLAEGVVEALCVETQAQGGVLWIADERDSGRLHLGAARGLVRPESEPECLEPADLPKGAADANARSFLEAWGSGAGARQALFLPLRRDGRILALARLSDKLGGGEFDPVDRTCAEKLQRFAEMALCSALRIRSLERRSLRDPLTGACVMEYLEDAARMEIEKANRGGGVFSLLKLELKPLEGLRRERGEDALQRWLGAVVESLRSLTRSTDLISADGAGACYALLSESDGVGAALLKERLRRALEGGELLGALEAPARPELAIAVASYPADGNRLEALLRSLDARLAEERRSPIRVLGLERRGLAETLEALLGDSDAELPQTAGQIARFVLAELVRRPRDRGVLYVAPGPSLRTVVWDSLAALEGAGVETEIVVIDDAGRPPLPAPGVSWVAPPRGQRPPPFLLRYGDAPAYAMVRGEKEGSQGVPFFHTTDRSLVEHLLFQLQGELGLKPPAGGAR